MGCWDESTQKWYTVTKVANGFDDNTLRELQTSIDMHEKQEMPPAWLVVHKSLEPDFVVADPERAPVWEITGAEFSQSDKHTADGISIRFPRITRQRADKTWQEATTLSELRALASVAKKPKTE